MQNNKPFYEYYDKEYIGAKYLKNRYWIFFKRIVFFFVSELSVTRCVRFSSVSGLYRVYKVPIKKSELNGLQVKSVVCVLDF